MSNRYVSIADRFITMPFLQGTLHSRDLANDDRILAFIRKVIFYIRFVQMLSSSWQLGKIFFELLASASGDVFRNWPLQHRLLKRW